MSFHSDPLRPNADRLLRFADELEHEGEAEAAAHARRAAADLERSEAVPDASSNSEASSPDAHAAYAQTPL